MRHDLLMRGMQCLIQLSNGTILQYTADIRPISIALIFLSAAVFGTYSVDRRWGRCLGGFNVVFKGFRDAEQGRRDSFLCSPTFLVGRRSRSWLVIGRWRLGYND